MIFSFFVLCCMLSYPKPNIVVHDSYTVRRHFERCYSPWTASDYHLRVGLRRPIRLQEMLYSPQNLY